MHTLSHVNFHLQVGINGGTDGAIEVKPALKWVSDMEVAGIDLEVRAGLACEARPYVMTASP